MKTIMQTCLLLILLTTVQIYCGGVTYGQLSQDDKTILRKAVIRIIPLEKIVYVDTVSRHNRSLNFVLDRLSNAIQNGKLSDKRNGDTLTLSKTEQKYILTQLEQQTVWPVNLFPNSKRIDTDSMTSHIRQMNLQRRLKLNLAKLQKDTLTIKKLRYDLPYVFTFLKPIYIRDKTICLIAFSAICGGECGLAETSLYKKEKNGWSKWMILSAIDY